MDGISIGSTSPNHLLFQTIVDVTDERGKTPCRRLVPMRNSVNTQALRVDVNQVMCASDSQNRGRNYWLPGPLAEKFMSNFLSAEQLEGHDVHAEPAIDIGGESLTPTQKRLASNIHLAGDLS